MAGPNAFADILLVEDNPGDARLVEEMAAESALDPTIHTVTDGADAVDFLHQRGAYADAPRPDAILLDLHLPRMDGEDVLAELTDDLEEIPTIVLSGSQQGASLKLDDVEDDVDACVIKPLDPEGLEELAATICEED